MAHSRQARRRLQGQETENPNGGRQLNAGDRGEAAEWGLAFRVLNLRLYVAGQSAKCVAAVRNLNRFCEQHLSGKYSIEVIDLLENPRLARDDQNPGHPHFGAKVAGTAAQDRGRPFQLGTYARRIRPEVVEPQSRQMKGA